ncbi:MAG: hypothetical protein JST00_08950 [Deltaproteobacteria bacterium]|nr:hypothetical protein [Deltaproteobacteria bacterium]
MTALVAAIATTSLALAAGCGASTESEGPTDDGAEIGESASALQIGTGFTTKTQSELEADGWTCKLLSGTTITFCTKPGTSGSWSCNDRGTCTQNKTAPPKPPIYGTTSGIVIGGTLSP